MGVNSLTPDNFAGGAKGRGPRGYSAREIATQLGLFPADGSDEAFIEWLAQQAADNAVGQLADSLQAQITELGTMLAAVALAGENLAAVVGDHGSKLETHDLLLSQQRADINSLLPIKDVVQILPEAWGNNKGIALMDSQGHAISYEFQAAAPGEVVAIVHPTADFSAIDTAQVSMAPPVPPPPPAPPPPPPPPPVFPDEPIEREVVFGLWGESAEDTDFRTLVNDYATTPPTENLLTYIGMNRDEDGSGGDPTREPLYATVDDEEGGNRLTRLTYTAEKKPFAVINNGDGALPAASYNFRMRLQAEGSDESMRIGHTGEVPASYTAINVLASGMQNYDKVVAQGYSIGLTSHTGNAGAVILAEMAQLYDNDTAFAAFPTYAEELAAFDGHAKCHPATKNSIILNAAKSVVMTNTGNGLIAALQGHPDATFFDALTLIIGLSPTEYPVAAHGNGICVDYSPVAEFNTTNTKLQLGLIGGGDATRKGMIQSYPFYASGSSSQYDMVGQGYNILSLRLGINPDTGVMERTVELNGGIIAIDNAAFAGIYMTAMRILSYRQINKARAADNRLIGSGDGFYLYSDRLSDDELLQHVLWMRGKKAALGEEMSLMNAISIPFTDSIHAFSNSMMWQMAQDRTMVRNMPMVMEGVGGSALYGTGTTNGWLRRWEAKAQRLVRTNSLAGYGEVLCEWLPFANEQAVGSWPKVGGIPSFLEPAPSSAFFTPEGVYVPEGGQALRSWMTDFLAMVDRTLALGPNVSGVLGYGIPRADAGPESEEARQNLMEYWDDNWEDNFDYKIEYGRSPNMTYADSVAAFETFLDTDKFQAGGTHPTYFGHSLYWNDPSSPTTCAKPLYSGKV